MMDCVGLDFGILLGGRTHERNLYFLSTAIGRAGLGPGQPDP